MRVKTALWALSLAVLVAGGWCGNCFGQSDVGLAPSGVHVPAATRNPGQLFVSAASPNSMDRLDSQADAVVGDAAGNAGLEESDSAPKSTGKKSTSKVGIGVKFSTLGVGIEAATPLTYK